MTLAQISVILLLGIIDGARRILGEDAINIANNVEGLKTAANGEITVNGDGMKILRELLKQYEEALHGEIILDLDVRVNVKQKASSNNI